MTKDDMSRSLRIDVVLAPMTLELVAPSLASTTTIVVDVIRATTSIAVLFERGCRRVLVAPDIDAARAAKSRRPNALLAGEVNGAAPAGFDLGNSPAEIAVRDVTGREVIMATTNGTRALRACSGSRATFAGSLRNASAVATAAVSQALNTHESERGALRDVQQSEIQDSLSTEPQISERNPDIVVVCSGRGGLPAVDDTICAGYLCRKFAAKAEGMGCVAELGEGARIALAAAHGAIASGSLLESFSQSEAGRAVASIGLSGDLDWCVATNSGMTIPMVTGREPDGLLIIENMAAGAA